VQVHARANGKGQEMEHLYRRSKLTLALKNSFLKPGAQTTVIATVSPASKDTEHSLNTLRHACVMGSNGDATGGSGGFGGGSGLEGHVTGGTMRTVMVGEVDVVAFARRARSGNAPSDAEVASNGNAFGGPPDPWDALAGKKLQVSARDGTYGLKSEHTSCAQR